MAVTVTSPSSSKSLRPAVEQLASAFSARAAEGDAGRTMPPDLVHQVSAAGLFAMSRPRELGGLELDPLDQLQLIEHLAHADGSAGWTVMIGAANTFAWLATDVAAALLAPEPGIAISQMIGPLGRATPDGPDAYIVTGRWPFNSGCLHADLHVLGVQIDGGPSGPEHGPDWRLAFINPADATIIDTWDAFGLRGTGSHDIAVSAVRVPAEHLMVPFGPPAAHDGPLWRVPFVTQLAIGHAGFSLGVGRRALDEFTALATLKKRSGARDTVATTGDAQVALARADGGLEAARSFVSDALAELWDTASAGDPPDLRLRARVLSATLNAQRAAEAAVDAVLPLAGAGAIYNSQALQRCYRDLHTAGQHIFVSADAWKRCARLRLGIDQPTFLI